MRMASEKRRVVVEGSLGDGRLAWLTIAEARRDPLAGPDVELLQDVGDVVIDRALGDEEFGGDLAVGKSLCYEDSDLLLAGGEPFRSFADQW